MYNQTVLENGLRVITKPMQHLNSTALGVWIGVGGRFENKINSGISHFLEHMVFKGTTKRSAEDIKRSIEGLGGTLNGFTAEECTCYWVKILGEHQDVAFSVLSDMVLDPKLNRKDMEKERTVILEEIKMYRDLPQHYVHELLDEILWPGQPLSMPLTGSAKSVTSMTRGDLSGFIKKYYEPQNIVVIAAGAVDEEKLISEAERFFKNRKKGRPANFKRVDLSKKSSRVKFFFKETEQTHLSLGIYGLNKFDPDRHVLSLINIILGANMSSRLFNEVREKRGLAYQIVSHLKEYHDTGLFSVSAGIDNKKLIPAVEIIIREISKMKTSSVKTGELSRAKEFYRGQFLMMAEEPLNHMIWLGDKIIGGDKLLDHNQILKNVDKVTKEDIKRVAKRIFRPKSTKAAFIGPLKDKVAATVKDITEEL